MTDIILIIVACLASAFLTTQSLKAGEPYQLGKIAQPLIEQCELGLPRNKECILIAVIKE